MTEEIPMMADLRLKNDRQKKVTLSTEVTIMQEPAKEYHQQQYQQSHNFYNLQTYRYPQLKKKRDEDASKRQTFLQFPDISTQNFMESIRNKDISTVKNELDNYPTLTEYTNDLGVSALEEAVKSGSVDILKMFLKKIEKNKKGIIIEHALLYAIRENHKDIVSFLLAERAQFCLPLPKKHSNIPSFPTSNQNEYNGPSTLSSSSSSAAAGEDIELPSKKHKKHEKDKFKAWTKRRDHQIPEYEDAEYASFITPIVLAAKLERLEMIELLIENDASEIHPMTVDCPFVENTCEICTERKVFKSRRNLEESNRLLEIYKALSSPGYILLSGAVDPILEVFELSREMEQMKNEDPSFKDEYDAIGNNCRHFAREMLDLCRTTQEVKTLLERSDGVEEFNSEGESTEFPRLLVALYFQQKEFIAHPYCQQVLQKSWYEGLPDRVCKPEWHYLRLFIYVLLWVPMWPIASLLFMIFKCWPWLIRLMKYPINKFITDTLSFMTFLILLAVNNIFYQNTSHLYKAGDWYNPIENLLIIWIIGMSVRQVKMIHRHIHCCKPSVGPKSKTNYLSLRWFDTIILACFWLWIILSFIGILIGKYYSEVKLPRYLWKDCDIMLASEPFFACGTVLSFFRLTGLLKAFSSLGPLQISLKKMIIDVVRFLIIFMFIMSGFVVAISKIYSSYEGNEQIDVANKERKTQHGGYIGFRHSYTNLFWNVFGYGDLYDNANIVVGSVYNRTVGVTTDSTNDLSYLTPTTSGSEPSPEASPDVINHKYTQAVGYFLIGSYHVVVIVVLLNMLIAMMAHSYEAIERHSDCEWKFARTRLCMTYYSEVGSLPAPFNIMLIGNIMKRVVKCCGKCSSTCSKFDDKYLPEKQPKDAYYELMEKLSKRYRNRKIVQQKEKL